MNPTVIETEIRAEAWLNEDIQSARTTQSAIGGRRQPQDGTV
jgi:hypothetical protein